MFEVNYLNMIEDDFGNSLDEAPRDTLLKVREVDGDICYGFKTQSGHFPELPWVFICVSPLDEFDAIWKPSDCIGDMARELAPWEILELCNE